MKRREFLRLAAVGSAAGLTRPALANAKAGETTVSRTGNVRPFELDELTIAELQAGMASGKYSQMMDSFAVFRCGKKVFERTYAHDYTKIYGKEAGERGPTPARRRRPARGR